eukprot:c11203_g1_i1.p1 GENE.c11203_g1_i1~~c11203_g1_i1.p1  ORF type:complete len:247 (+),score=68.27 c11203_g1_i1:38-778(+)
MAVLSTVRLILYILCLAVAAIGTVLVATTNHSDSQTFACVCSCLLCTACLCTIHSVLGAGVAAPVTALAFFWFPIGIETAHLVELKNNKSESDKKVIAGFVLCLGASMLSLLVSASTNPPSFGRVVRHPTSILAVIGFVVAFTGCCVIWAESDNISLSIQGVISSSLGVYCGLFPSSTLNTLGMFLVTYVGCVALYVGLQTSGTSYGSGVLCLASGLLTLLVALLAAFVVGNSTEIKVFKTRLIQK